MRGLNEECGVVGLVNVGDAAVLCKQGLYMLQHRGQEAAGIVSYDDKFYQYKNHGLVSQVFSDLILDKLVGSMAIGHVRYATCGDGGFENIQPFLFYNERLNFSLCHNGNIVNAKEIKSFLSDQGVIFHSNSDSEILGHLIMRNFSGDFLSSLKISLNMLQGAFAFLIMYDGEIYCCRDKNFMRPLSIASLDGGFVAASETCVFDSMGAEFVCDVLGGEIVVIGDDVRHVSFASECKNRVCAMEFVYFSRPDSTIDGLNVYEVRKSLGRQLGIDYASEIADFGADIVVGVPDSSLACAAGLSQELGIMHEYALVKHKYSGRSFIEPTEKKRREMVNLKLNVISSLVKGKRVILVDDSIVRGTTSRQLIRLFKAAGVESIMFLVASPMLRDRCYYGVDIHSREELIGFDRSHDEIRSFIGCDFLGYLSLDSLKLCLRNNSICTGCFDSNYPTYVGG